MTTPFADCDHKVLVKTQTDPPRFQCRECHDLFYDFPPLKPESLSRSWLMLLPIALLFAVIGGVLAYIMCLAMSK